MILIILGLFACNRSDNYNKSPGKDSYKTGSKKTDELIRSNPYEEQVNCARIDINKYGIISERFRSFNEAFETEMFTEIDSVCVIAYSSQDLSKKIMIEFWNINDSVKANKIYQYLLEIPNKTIFYKPPQFWNWKLLNDGILFYYSFETSPKDEFFIKVFNQPVRQNNFCL